MRRAIAYSKNDPVRHAAGGTVSRLRTWLVGSRCGGKSTDGSPRLIAMAGPAGSRHFNLACGTVPGATFLGTLAHHVSDPPSYADPLRHSTAASERY
jgi:hypothetical protein